MDAPLLQLAGLCLGLFMAANGLGILVTSPSAVERMERAGIPVGLWPPLGVAAICVAGGLLVGAFVVGVDLLTIAAGVALAWYVVVSAYEVGARGRPSGMSLVHGSVAAVLLLIALRAWLQLD